MSVEYRRRDRHVYRHIAGEHLLISLHREVVAPLYAFTPSAVALWERLASWQSADALVAALQGQFEVSPEEASRDVRDFLQQLEEIQALDVREVGT